MPKATPVAAAAAVPDLEPALIGVPGSSLARAETARHFPGGDAMRRVSIGAASVLVGLFVLLLLGHLAAATQASQPAKATPANPVNINTANAEQLDTLPGIGAKLAARIVEYRQKNGAFKKIEDLMNVQGIGEKNFLKLKPQLTVASTRAEAR